jgi:uncharacterized membrane protein
MRRRTWAVPALYAAGAIAAGLVLPRVESRMFSGFVAPISIIAAMAIYSSIASGMIALTGIVFSLVFVMVQFSATAYSPRLALWVGRSPLISHALGTFTATFLYAIAALAWVDRGGTGTVPAISAATVVVLLLASVFTLIGLVERIALLSVNKMLTFTGDQGRRVLDAVYPELEPRGAAAAANELGQAALTQRVIYHGRPAVVQAVDVAALIALARSATGRIEVVPAVGDSLIESTTLMNVFGARGAIDERALRRAIAVGEERTFEQDPKYSIRLLVDIAIRALSPAVNDPTTAVQALDHIGDLLMRLARRRLEIGSYCDGDGTPRLVVPFPTWEDFLRLSLDEIQSYGAGSMQVMRRMKALMADLLSVVSEERRAAVASRQERLERTIARAFSDQDDQRDASVEDRQGLGVPRTRSAA